MYLNKKNTFKQIFYSKGMLAFIIVLIFLVCYGLFPIIQKSVTVSRERKSAEIESVDLQKKQAELTKKIDLLKTEAGQNDALKEQYPFVSAGEKVIVITDDGSATTSEKSTSTEPAKKSFWDFIKNLF